MGYHTENACVIHLDSYFGNFRRYPKGSNIQKQFDISRSTQAPVNNLRIYHTGDSGLDFGDGKDKILGGTKALKR